jgi:hypothetical protein
MVHTARRVVALKFLALAVPLDLVATTTTTLHEAAEIVAEVFIQFKDPQAN